MSSGKSASPSAPSPLGAPRVRVLKERLFAGGDRHRRGGFFSGSPVVSLRAVSVPAKLWVNKNRVFSNAWAPLVQRLQEIPAKPLKKTTTTNSASPIHLEKHNPVSREITVCFGGFYHSIPPFSAAAIQRAAQEEEEGEEGEGSTGSSGETNPSQQVGPKEMQFLRRQREPPWPRSRGGGCRGARPSLRLPLDPQVLQEHPPASGAERVAPDAQCAIARAAGAGDGEQQPLPSREMESEPPRPPPLLGKTQR